MELEAAIQALNYAFETLSVKGVVLYSDSKYVVQGSTLWLSGWKKRGWKRRKGAVKNQDQWERMADILEKHGNKTEICWIKGHNGNKYNDLADSLANEARTTGHLPRIKFTHITN
jgi:ribonuclease HI